MSEKKEIRLLEASEIECRVNTVQSTRDGVSCSLLLYKDARVDMRLLDETFGEMNWKRSHEVIDGKLYCTISVWDAEKKEWVGKQDVGVESNTEKEKGQASDSFKRAGFNWGIGRELYTTPSIWIRLKPEEVTDKGNGKKTTYAKFYVAEIGYNVKREIDKLVIKDRHGIVRYSSNGNSSSSVPNKGTEENPTFDMVCNDIKNAASMDALEAVWKEYSALHSNQVFKALVNKRKAELNGAA